ncbi:helix-turn-helix transcriptional regulator [Streptococcus merionis]|uniref:helix-turn-helix transcriptional regulator n=1 Tax=Streptococcus merionis TaxID=400065 RepID=UPI003516D78E
MENHIQTLRKAQKLSQAELADELSVTRQTIISLEKGRYNASLELAYKIAKFFNTTIEDIFVFDELNED